MFKLIKLNWRRIPENTAKNGVYISPFKEEIVLLVVENKIFSASWVDEWHPDYDPDIAKIFKESGYWRTSIGGYLEKDKPSKWASVEELNPVLVEDELSESSPDVTAAKRLIKQYALSREIKNGGFETLINPGGWVQAKFEPAEKIWLDVFGRKIKDRLELERVMVIPPLRIVSEGVIVKGIIAPLWGI